MDISFLGIADPTGPHVIASLPSQRINLSAKSLDSLTVTFDEAIDYSHDGSGSFSTEDISISGPDGTVAPMGINYLGENRYEITFAPQTLPGSYQVSVGRT